MGYTEKSQLEKLEELQSVADVASQSDGLTIGVNLPHSVRRTVYLKDGTHFEVEDFIHTDKTIAMERDYILLFAKALRLGLLQLIAEEENK